MVSRSKTLLSWLAFPIYAWQGLATRANTLRLEPPITSGTISVAGQGDTVNILLIGDSSAAGVGVRRIEDSLGGQLPKVINKLLKRPVTIRIAGMNSATSDEIRDHVVPHLTHTKYDYICLNIGTNDAKNFHRGHRFCDDFGTLLYALKAKFPEAMVIWSGVIDLAQIPTLPTPLNKILGIRAGVINRNGRILCAERGALAPNPDWRIIRENFSIDGFHASEQGYLEWAEKLGAYIADIELIK